MNKSKMVFLVSAILAEIAGIILLVKAVATDSSITQGLIFLVVGMLFLVIGIAKKPTNVETHSD